MRALCGELQKNPAYADTLTPAYVETLAGSVPMYDMGTVGIPDRILLKPGRLTPDEIAIMRTHTTLGHDALVRAEKTLGRASPLLTVAKELALCHQEKWDGSGYPQALQGDAIPLSARLMAVADVYDALISRRVYKAAMPHEQAVQIIQQGRGQHFDPDIADAFVALQVQFQSIAGRFSDSDEDIAQKKLLMDKFLGDR